MHPVWPLLQSIQFPQVTRTRLSALQVNLGYRCNQSCVHCHVNAGPHRTEEMDSDTVDEVIGFLEINPDIHTLDLTGGAPELNPYFYRLVAEARRLGRRVIDRCNLTILLDPEGAGLAEFLAAQRVEIVASLPCYLEENVDKQRGRGSFDASIAGLLALNNLGYGVTSDLPLSLVYNPQGPALPPAQDALEGAYRTQLRQHFGIEFTRLLTLANMPIQRFGSQLVSRGEFENYLALLQLSHQPNNLAHVMCRELISVDWQGYVYDCDFNQQLGLPLGTSVQRLHLRDVNAAALSGAPVRVAAHCYGCTAGQGSSCGGALKAANTETSELACAA
jgi:radical SAM/Cys-rich protein